MAKVVLRRWNITSTMDFGRIVYAMIESGHLRRREQDSIEDFSNVFNFETDFDAAYRIQAAQA